MILDVNESVFIVCFCFVCFLFWMKLNRVIRECEMVGLSIVWVILNRSDISLVIRWLNVVIVCVGDKLWLLICWCSVGSELILSSV